MTLPLLRAAALSLLLVAQPTIAWADDNTADEADLAFALGNDAYAARRYDEALRNYFLSYRLVPNRNVLFNIARCYEAMERFDEAYRYYRDLSRAKLAEDDARDVNRSLQRLRPRVALVTVTSEPEGASVFVDRLDLGSRGVTPLTLALPPGAHEVIVQREGHRSRQEKVTLTRGREVKADLKLELITGRVAVSGEPAGAWIRETVEGPDLGSVPGEVVLRPGRRLLFVGAAGHATAQHLVEVKADQTIPLAVKLGLEAKPTGKLIVTANRESALVTVDGVESGFTPAVVTVTEGEHELVVSLPDLTPLRRKVLVEKDAEVRVHAELRYEPPPVKAASKSLASVDESPASITVISREELEAFGYQTLSEALASVRGIYLSNDRMYSYLGIRGFSPPGDLNTRVLILWDGHALNDVWAGQGFAGRDLDVDLDEVERIEIVRGPGSALYGTGAFFAVINLVPRDALRGNRNLEVTAGTGALGAYRAHAAASWSGDADTSVIVSGAAYDARGAELTRLGAESVFGQDSEKAYGASARARFGGFTLFARVNNRHKDIPTAPFGTLLNASGTRATDSRGFAELRWDKTFESGSSASVRGYYDGTRYRGRWPSAGEEEGEVLVFRDAGSADWAGTEARYRLSLFGGSNHLTLGAEAQHQFRVTQELFAESSQPLESRSRTLLSAYLLDEWRIHPRVFLSAGLRVDRYLDLDETPITPRLALVLNPYDRGVTKLVAGQAFRAPNIYELHYHDLNLTQRPALALESETISTVELEHAHDLTREVRFTVAGYHNRITNLVVLETEEGDPQCGAPVGSEPCLVYANAPGLLRAFGAEVGMRWQPGRHALVDASYSFVNLVGASSDLQSGTPAHLASGRLLLPLVEPSVRLALQANYQSARRSERLPLGSGEALLLNVGLSGETKHLRYFAGVQNLLDVQYALPVGDEFVEPAIPQYGRTFTLQLTGSY